MSTAIDRQQPITPERITEIETTATAEGLTEGPWEPLYEGCDCGGDYGCGHGQYVWAIHTPVLTSFWANRTMPDGQLPPGAYDRSELAEFTSADLEFVAAARTAVPELLAEVKRLTGLLTLALEHLEPCPAPDIAHGWDLCPHGEKWPCKATKAAWQLRRLDPDQQIVAVLDGVMRTRTQEAAGA